MTDAGEPVRPTTSTRDRADLRARLAAWLSTKVADASISELSAPSSNGMSSETLLFEAHWREDGADVTQPCAARLAPASDALPVFPVYDLEKQFRVMRLVAERTPVPVPRTLWFEPSADAVGSPFFVMERVTGDVPPDVMPYTFGSWLLDASAADQRRVQDNAVSVLAGIHAVAASEDELAFLALDSPGATPLRRHVAHERAYYEWVAADGLRSPLIEAAFRWLDDHWPATETPATISWGDARIGNMMFRDFRPVAVLDWEMAAVGPPEIDLGWMVFLHRFFQDLTEAAGMPGMPGFMQPDDVASTYEAASGHTPRDLDWFIVYAALRHGIVMSRVARRSIHFGEAEQPDDPDDLILHRSTIESMISRQ